MIRTPPDSLNKLFGKNLTVFFFSPPILFLSHCCLSPTHTHTHIHARVLWLCDVDFVCFAAYLPIQMENISYFVINKRHILWIQSHSLSSFFFSHLDRCLRPKLWTSNFSKNFEKLFKIRIWSQAGEIFNQKSRNNQHFHTKESVCIKALSSFPPEQKTINKCFTIVTF